MSFGDINNLNCGCVVYHSFSVPTYGAYGKHARSRGTLYGMCGRYTLTNAAQLALRFSVPETAELAELAEAAPRYNIAPTQAVPTIRTAEQGDRVLQMMRWGFQPGWLAERAGPSPINARAETLLERPLFRGAVARRRCLIPADGFYEWQALPGSRTKQPIYAALRDGGLFAFAGLYADGQNGSPPSCAIITTAPNALMTPVHNRMPAILSPADEAAWLDPELTEPAALLTLLRPYPAERMRLYPVGPLVSSARNEGPALIAPLGAT